MMPGVPGAACASPMPTATSSATTSAVPCQALKRHGSARAEAERLEHGQVGAVRDHAGAYPGMRSARSQRPIT